MTDLLSSNDGIDPHVTSRFSPSITLLAGLVNWSADKWINKSDIPTTGSFSSSPIAISITVPSFLQTTPYKASGIVTHWYFLTPP